jgi:hypothetical protein
MDAGEYIGNFNPTLWDNNDSNLQGVNLSELLEEVIATLYITKDVYFIGDLPSPRSIDVAREALELQSVMSYSQSLIKGKYDLSQIARTGKLGLLSFKPIEAPKERTDIADQIDEETAWISSAAVSSSTSMLSNAILKVNSKAPVKDAKRNQVLSWAVKGSIGESRRTIVNLMQQYSGIVQVRQKYYEGKPLDLQVETTRPNVLRVIPDWLKESTEKDKPLHRLCAALSELDVYFSLLEWVQINNLPYLPVYSPDAFEHGDQIGPNKKNLRSDILLCSLASDEIVPIQSKSIHQHLHKEQYDGDNVVLISPQDIGCVKSELAIVTVDGRNKTGWESVTTYGELMTSWLQFYREKKPSHGSRKKLHASMQPAFEFFDREIKPKFKKI